MEITVGISLGEAADRLSILQVKALRIVEEPKRLVVERDQNRLFSVLREEIVDDRFVPEFWQAVGRLHGVNLRLWDVLAQQRDSGGDVFVSLSRDVMTLNDERYQIKHALDDAFGADFSEQKEYR